MNVSENIKDGIFYNSNPNLNPRAVALYSVGKVEIGDVVLHQRIEYRVVETGLRVRVNGKMYKHAIRVEALNGKFGQVLVNVNESTDFSGIWVF
jgi:hypothetical protein